MAWNDLNIQQKAELMKLYVASGITNLDTIKQHYNNFQDGGIINTTGELKNEEPVYQGDVLEPATLQDKPDALSQAASDNNYFIKNWLTQRSNILNQNTKDTQNFVQNWFYKQGNELNNQLNKLNSVQTYSNGIKELPNIDPTSPLLSNGLYSESDGMYLGRQADGSFQTANGLYRPDLHQIYINPLRNRDSQASTIIHERTHSLGLTNPQVQAINKFQQKEFLREGQQGNKYNDTPWEIYARLMQFRHDNNIDPTKVWKAEEIQQLRDNIQGDSENDILQRYNDEFILHLFNDVAQNNSSLQDTIHYAANGGSLGKVTPYGQWQYPGEVTTIPSNNITMKGVDYPVIGVSNTGNTKYMLPNMDYLFDGQYVTEYPVHKFQEGGDTDDIPNKHWYDNYRTWRRKMSKYKGIDIKHDDDYDYKGFYKENQAKAWGMLDENPEEHFTDLYKYPTHPTFSSQSKYSQQWQQEHNIPKWASAPRGGDWGTDEEGNNVFYHSYFTAATPEKVQRTAQYLRENDPDIYALFNPKPTGKMLPTITVTSETPYNDPVRLAAASLYMPKAIQDKIDEIDRYYQERAAQANRGYLDTETIDLFNSRIWDLENQAREGYNPKTGRWTAHKSPEGGAETIGGGIKLGETNPKWDKIYRKQGYLTDTQVKEAMDEAAQDAYNGAKKAYTRIYGKGEWKRLNPDVKALLMDIEYNAGNVASFKELLKAIHNQDIKGIATQHHRSYTDEKGKTHPVKNRNNYFDSIFNNYSGKIILDD